MLLDSFGTLHTLVKNPLLLSNSIRIIMYKKSLFLFDIKKNFLVAIFASGAIVFREFRNCI